MKTNVPDAPPSDEPHSLTALLASLYPAPGDTHVSLAEMLHRVGERSFAPIVLVVALILVSPVSAIPGAPSLGMLVVVLVSVQAVIGRRYPWLPQILTRRSLPAPTLARALDWLQPGAVRVDRLSRDRLRGLALPPVDRLVFGAIVLTALPWPLLEVLPTATSIGAFVVSLFAIGLLLRDGAWIVAGCAMLAGMTAGLLGILYGFF